MSRGPLPPWAARVTRTPRMAPAVAPARAVGVGQEPVGAVQRHEGTRHRGDTGDDPAAVQVADAVRPAGPPDREVEQRAVARHRDADLARAGGGADARGHGIGQPRPRSSCAVSNSGRPTTLE